MNGHKGTYSVLVFLLVSACMVRVWGVQEPSFHVGDEGLHIPAAIEYRETGHANPDHYAHPPLKYHLLNASMKVWGDNPAGWRMRNVIFGSLSVAVLFLIGIELFSSVRVAGLAAAFLAFDPLHLVLSRSTFDEIPTVLFFLAGLYALIRYLKGSAGYLPLAGLFFGLAVSMKWYFVISLAAVTLFALLATAQRDGRRWLRGADIVSACIIIPVTIYLIVFIRWFDRGYGIWEFIQMQFDAYREFQFVQAANVNPALAGAGMPWEWFVRPLLTIRTLGSEGEFMRVLAIMSSPLVWLLVLPSMTFMVYRIVRTGEYLANPSLVPIVFMCTYLPMLFIHRPMFLYSAISCLLPAALAVSYTAITLADSFKRPLWATSVIMVVFLAWSAYVYPLTTGFSVKKSVYAPLFTVTGSSNSR